MSHRFVILNDGIIETYNKYEDIPEFFDNIIEFAPEIPEGPHTHEEHDEIDQWNKRLKELLSRERK